MVQYKTLVNVINDYVLKCYPKENALKYFEAHKEEFLKNSYPNVNLFQQRESVQEDVDYTFWEKTFLFSYASTYFVQLQQYNNEIYDSFERAYQDIYSDSVGKRDGDYTLNVEYTDENGEYNADYIKMGDIQKGIDSAIERSPPINVDCVVYRYGRLPVDNKGEPVNVGGHGKFKGYSGATYDSELVFDDYAQLHNSGWMNKENRYNLTIYTPKGTKGVAIGESVNCFPREKELLLGRNQKCIVLSRNDETKEAEILLY